MIFQYSSVTNAWISRSRSAINRTATDWTRPAQVAGAHLFPEERADLIADEPVEESPRLLGVDHSMLIGPELLNASLTAAR